jgi:O-antigen/teichoic acid export membrane protein
LTIKTITKNAGWLGLIQVMGYVIPFLTLPIVTRAFGPNIFGVFATINAYATYVGVLTSYGFVNAGPRAIVLLREGGVTVSKTASTCITAQFLLGVVAAAIFLAMLPAIPLGGSYELVGLVVVLQAFAMALVPQWIFIGLQQTRDFAVVQLVFRVLAAGLIFLTIRTPDDLLLYVGINCVAAISILVVSIFVLRRYGIRWHAPRVNEVFSAIRQGSHLFLSTVSISLYTTTTVVIISFVLGPVAAGAFALADRVRVAAGSIIDPITVAVYPLACQIADRQATNEEGRAKRVFFRAVIALSTFVSLTLFIGAPLIISLLGGKQFEDAIPVLQIIAFLPPIVALSNTLGKQTMLPLRMDREYTWVVASAALLGMTGISASAHHFGLPGAALMLTAVETFVTVAFAIIVQRRMSLLSLFFKHQ